MRTLRAGLWSNGFNFDDAADTEARDEAAILQDRNDLEKQEHCAGESILLDVAGFHRVKVNESLSIISISSISS
jgi:hypothetical protein